MTKMLVGGSCAMAAVWLIVQFIDWVTNLKMQ